jgi:hypothetical protein
VKIFIFLLATTISTDLNRTPTLQTSDQTPTMPVKGMAETRGGPAKKELGKAIGKMTKAQEEAEEWDWKVLKQCHEEVMSRVVANLAAEKEKIQDTEVVAVELVQALSEMEMLDAADPVSPGPVEFHRLQTASGLVSVTESSSRLLVPAHKRVWWVVSPTR